MRLCGRNKGLGSIGRIRAFACDGAGAEQRVDVKALLLSPLVIVLAVRVRHKVVATPVIFRAAIDATAFRRGFVFLKYQGM